MLCGKKKSRMDEIELEFKRGDLEKFKEFVVRLSPLPFTSSKTSKFEEAMRNLPKGSPACPVEALDDLANHILKMNFEKLKDSTKDFRQVSTLKRSMICEWHREGFTLQLKHSKEYFQLKPKTFEKISKNWTVSLEKNGI